MSVPFHPSSQRSAADADRAAAAYRMASRLTRRHTPVREWEKLCLADRERRTLRPFADLFAPEMDDDNIIDAEFVEVPDPSDVDHQVRAAYLLVAVMAGTLCMVLGGLLLI